MYRFLLAGLLAAGLAAGAAHAADAKAAKGVPAVVAGAVVEAEAEVVAIDQKTRKVTLKEAEGNVSQIVVGPEVKNLPQVKVGDRVVARYSQALTLKLKQSPGVRVTEEKSDSAKAAPGEKPAAATAREVHFVADVTAVDAKGKKITVKGAKGKTVDLAVKDKALLSKVKVGDQVEGTFVQVLAIAVIGPEAKK
jgi:Cu/Ag efflux protein CusF